MSDETTARSSDIGLEWTVAEMSDRLSRVASVLVEATKHAEELARWASGLPEHHNPYREPVLVTDLVVTTVKDPSTLAGRVSDLVELAQRVGGVTEAIKERIAADLGIFATPSAEAEQAIPPSSWPTVLVTARLGAAFGDDQSFERQRLAVRQSLTFDGRDRWWGSLPTSIHDDPGRWQSVLDAVAAGAVAYIDVEMMEAEAAE